MKIQIEVYVPHFFPASDSIGPAKSIVNLLTRCYRGSTVNINTSNRDLAGNILDRGLCSPSKLGFVGTLNYMDAYQVLRHCVSLMYRINNSRHTFYYFNSLFSFRFTLLPIVFILLNPLLILGRSPPNIVIAPRGELYPAALAYKWRRKKVALYILKIILSSKGFVRFHASNEDEAKQLVDVLALKCSSRVTTEIDVPDRLTSIGLSRSDRGMVLQDDRVRFLYFSKVLPKKNLSFLIKVFETMGDSICSSKLSFNVAGPITDEIYGYPCIEGLKRICEMKGISFSYLGEIDVDKVSRLLEAHDVLLFPTLGENFGHVIYEALDHGLAVFTSKATPWVEKRPALYCLDTDDPTEWSNALHLFCQQWKSASYRSAVTATGHYLCASLTESSNRSRLFYVQ